MTQTLSPCLLDPHIDLTSEEAQWEYVELVYRCMIYDEFQFTDRLKYFCVKWLLENRKWPKWWSSTFTWDWFHEEVKRQPQHCLLGPLKWFHSQNDADKESFSHGHNIFGESVLWFCSLWPRFYVDVVLPTQEGEPENPDEFWENLNLCMPGEDWETCCHLYRGRSDPNWIDGGKYSNMNPYRNALSDPHYRWTYGNAILRAVKAWKGDKE